MTREEFQNYLESFGFELKNRNTYTKEYSVNYTNKSLNNSFEWKIGKNDEHVFEYFIDTAGRKKMTHIGKLADLSIAPEGHLIGLRTPTEKDKYIK